MYRYTLKEFQEACSYGKLEWAKRLTNLHNITIEHVQYDNNLAIRSACANNRLETAQWLVKNFNLTNKDIKSDDDYALKWACIYKHEEIIKWLLDNYYNLEEILEFCKKHYFIPEKTKTWLKNYYQPVGIFTKPVKF